MEIPQETEEYVRESIDYTVGLRASTDTLILKIDALETENVHLRRRYLSLQSKIREKDDIIGRSRAEASMSAVALKKFVEENQKLALECSNLLEECNKWKRECTLYDHDRDALMDFADDRAKEAEIRYQDLEEEKKKVEEELLFYKSQSECNVAQVDVSRDEHFHEELLLLDSILTTMFFNEDRASNAHDFLDAQISDEACQKLLKNWDSLMPATQKIIELVANVKSLVKDKENLTINLRTAEDEVTVLFDENNILKEEIKRLMRQCYKEKHVGTSGGGSNSGKVKRKSSPVISSPEVKKFSDDINDVDIVRQPFSPLPSNSPESRIRKK